MPAVLLAESPDATIFSWAAVVTALILFVVIAPAFRRIRRTTLTGPWYWAVAALAALATVECLIATGLLRENLEAWRFAAAAGIYSPWMSLLGAKRPQDQSWHFIVGTLWGIQALPAAEVLLLRPGQPLAIIDFRAVFLMGLIGLSLLVYLPTRYSIAAWVAAAGQTVLMWGFLPWTNVEASAWQVFLALSLLLIAATIAWMRARRSRPALPLDRVWLDFRDGFGALWAMRVHERINAAADLYEWPVRLGWGGFHRAAHSSNPGLPPDIPPELARHIRKIVVNLLRRFVSVEWIDERLG